MPELSREPIRNVVVEWRTTLSELKGLLANTPEIFGDQVEEIRQGVEDAEAEVKSSGKLSQTTAERLDNLHRPFKRDFLK